MGNYQLILIQKQIGHAHGLIEQAATVAAKIYNEPVELWIIELLERIRQICVGGFIKR